MASFTIKIQPDWEIIAPPGTELSYSSALATLDSQQGQPQTVQLAHLLQFSPDKIFKYLKKGVGEAVHRGDVIAEHRSLMSTKRFFADAEGMITHIDHVAGVIVFEQLFSDSSSAHIMSLVEGTVGTTTSDEVQIKVAKTLEIEIEEQVPSRMGAPVILTDNAQATLLTLPQVAARIVVSGDFSDYVVSKLEALQAISLISRQKMHAHLSSFTLKKTDDFDDIVDFAPAAVYANASQSHITFYK